MKRYFSAAVIMMLFFIQPSHGQGEWAEFNLFDWSFESIPYWATSELQVVKEGSHKIDGIHGPGRLFDGRFSTCWIEGAEGDGSGETLLFAGKQGLKGLRIINGSPADDKINRVKKADISLFAGFSFPAYVSEIARGYLSFRIIDDTPVMLDDSYEPQDIAVPVDWDRVNLMLPELMAQFIKRFGVSVADVDVRFIVKFDIKEIYGEKDNTGISEISLMYDENFIKNARRLYQNMNDEDYSLVGCFMRQRLNIFSKYLVSEDYLKILKMFAPEDILTYADIYPDEIDNAENETAKTFLKEIVFLNKIKSLQGVRVSFLSAAFNEGLLTIKTRFTEKDGSVNDLELYIDGETGQFLAGPMADAKG